MEIRTQLCIWTTRFCIEIFMVTEPSLIVDLLPTQMTIGMREVHLKRSRLREHASNFNRTCFSTRLVPVVLGPDSRRYLIDRRHLTHALHDEGASEGWLHARVYSARARSNQSGKRLP
jgi:hypothetical protein